MKVPFFRPSLGREEEEKVLEVLRSGWLTTGPKVKEFETLLSSYLGGTRVVALSSCTAALHLSMLLVGVGPGDLVVTSPITFPATVNAIEMAGARPILCDIQRETLNMDPNYLEDLLRKGVRPRAIVPVHMAGQPCDMDDLAYLARRYGFAVVEDAAHALGASYKGHKVGSGYGGMMDGLKWYCAFSFYPNKPITTGEGGALVLQGKEEEELARLMSNHGITQDAWDRYGGGGFNLWTTVTRGFKYNMSDIQGALGTVQIKKADRFLELRKRVVHQYLELMEKSGLLSTFHPLKLKGDRVSSYHLMVVRVKGISREKVVTFLKGRGIGVGIHYIALFLHPYFRESYQWEEREFPQALEASKEVLSLPLYPLMKEEEVEYVVEQLERAKSKGAGTDNFETQNSKFEV